tara:strand:+ start:944 stop:2383 length:1440 start_codon:yes stop_codon:yes gene_type:complete
MANQASIIEQHPLYGIIPVGQEIVFVVSNDTAVANETQVKFVAQVHISTQPPNLSSTAGIIGTFKTTPNNAGVGIFDFRSILESYVDAENMAVNNSSYKGTTTSSTARHPIHLIDKFSKNDNTIRYMAIQFKVEYLGADSTQPNVVTADPVTAENSSTFKIFNGYLKHSDILNSELNSNNFGFDLEDFKPVATFPTVNTRKFLTNAPTTLYANIEDYGTFAFLQTSGTLATNVTQIEFKYYDSDGSALGSEIVTKNFTNGAYDAYSAESKKQILYVGCYPANLRNWSSTFQALVTAGTIQGGYYTVALENGSALATTALYTINVNCPDQRQYESIRLCWLNQWGAWDYYTFTKKSTRSISTQESTYTQLAGNWNERVYNTDSFRGGKKTFRRNATERIRINTNYVSESENVMFEELINSPEVYLLEGFQTDINYSLLTNYVKPVTVTTSNFTRRTVANDRLLQYTFEIEKSKTLRTQTV